MHSRRRIGYVHRWLLLALVVLVGHASAVDPAVRRAPGSDPAFHCSGEISPPVEIQFQTTMDQIQQGTTIAISGEVVLQEDAPSLTLRFEGLDGATLQGAPEIALGPHVAGESVPFSIPVQFASEGRAAVQVWADVYDETGLLLFARREGLYALLRPTGVVAGDGGYLALEQKAVEEDIQFGRIAPENVESARAATGRVEATLSSAPMVVRAFTPQEQELNRMVGAPAEGYAPAPMSPDAPAVNITVEGTVSWTDENGATHPVWGATVAIWDEDTGFDELITTVGTDMSGNYMASVDDDDGFLQGDRDIYVEVRAENTWIRTETTGNSLYVMTSGVWNETPGGSVLDYSPTAANTGTGPAMSVFQAATWIAAYIASDVEGAAYAQVNVVWPNGGSGSFYDGEVQIEQADRWDWDTIHHEYGHYAADNLNIEDNPGGPHNIGDCISNVQGTKSAGNRMAWAEGWPTYFGTSGQDQMNMASLNVPRVGDNAYADLEDGTLSYSLETADGNGRGEDNEVAVQRLLWDLYDSAADGRDAVSLSDNTIWNAIEAGAGAPHILSSYWADLRSGQSAQNLILMGEITSDQLIGPRLVSPAAGAILSPSNNVLDWQNDVGCPASYSGDGFDLVFFDANTFATILTVPGLGASTHALSNAQISTIIATTHNVLWGVMGYHSGSPATGPYLGETFAATVNRPPVADAGPDQPNVECASHTTTPVQLNGTGSSDPDGDALDYTWSAFGVSFNDPNSATPIGQFPEGTTVVTLTVSDGIEDDTDLVSITVVDTTPPAITCPAPIMVECSSHCGVAEDDVQIAGWYDDASAVDICDPDPLITDNHPACFPVGVTPVTFYATDHDYNVDSCTVNVTVVDTTPPEIAVILNRYALWPPNHKMHTILATVEFTDVCDPNPTFVLTSITSNEPDNGQGDGNTSNDIQGTVYGTSDTEFQLRAERQGGGDGRKYTIIYTAMDMSGNTAEDTVCVVVPHDQSGNALCSAGFTTAGAGLEPGAAQFQLIVLSSPSLDARDIDPTRAEVGNQVGAIQPIGSRYVDVNGDTRTDLALVYSAAAAAPLRQGTKKADPLGLHYSVGEDSHFLVSNIFALGSPVTVAVEATVGNEGDHPAEVDGLERIADGSGIDPGALKAPVVDENHPGMLALPEGGLVRVEVFDVSGRLVTTLADREMGPGSYDLRWNGRDGSGRSVPNGIYFYRVRAPGIQKVQKVLVAQ